MARLSKVKSPFMKFTKTHIFLISTVIAIGIFCYFNIFYKKPTAVYHMENFLTTKTDTTSGNYCQDSDKPYKLLFFFMESCPHCVDFQPIWKKFENNADKYKDKVCIAKVSADNDDALSKYKVKAFPTVILVKPDKNVVSFEDNRTIESLTAFVDQHVAKS
jgi:thioredoxin-like negative regulator of GroEL